MANIASTVQNYYSQGTLRDRIFGWLSENGVDPDQLTCEQLHPLDQLHGRGIYATREHAEHAAIPPRAKVLDLGCGVGGASRFLATEYSCRVTGIDLTPEFVDVATELTRRCGLADQVEHLQGDATDLPFDDDTFDHVWCHNVTMNIENKAALIRQVARVLKKNGRFSCVEVGQGPAGPATFPVPWAMEASSSFLVTPEHMQEIVEAGGLRIIKQIDLTAASEAFRKQEQERIARGERPLRANHIVMGDDFPVRAQNSAVNVAERRVIEHIIIAEKV